MATRILVVEDSTSFRKLIAGYLRRNGYDVFEAWSLESARKLMPSVRPTIMLLDLQLEDGEGYSLLADGKYGEMSTIVISAREGAEDRVACLQLGAEDYIVKPVDLMETLLRIKRVESLLMSRAPSSILDFDAFVLDLSNRKVIYPDGESAVLSRSEYELVRMLIEAGDQIVSRAAISDRVFQKAPDGKSRAIDVLVSKLRRKLDPAGCSSPIWSIRGEGYRFTAQRRAAGAKDTAAFARSPMRWTAAR